MGPNLFLELEIQAVKLRAERDEAIGRAVDAERRVAEGVFSLQEAQRISDTAAQRMQGEVATSQAKQAHLLGLFQTTMARQMPCIRTLLALCADKALAAQLAPGLQTEIQRCVSQLHDASNEVQDCHLCHACSGAAVTVVEWLRGAVVTVVEWLQWCRVVTVVQSGYSGAVVAAVQSGYSGAVL